ncbi:uncharacterized protein LOC125854718 [Solanum stenotomum]|uniref:uncharacterized protein LOC125854718 n=1 Tax=Solanum stenotomum TaxID=172797 RepID=UPI0020D1320D|nr:uncharacterized protein LOC125854718 [Solanum stenotomum]
MNGRMDSKRVATFRNQFLLPINTLILQIFSLRIFLISSSSAQGFFMYFTTVEWFTDTRVLGINTLILFIEIDSDSEMANDNVTVTVAVPTRTDVPPAKKLEKFSGVNFKGWQQRADFLCKDYILSALEDDLHNNYSAMTTLKELWDALEKKYKTKDACLKNFVVAKFLDYKMSDNKTVGSQMQELQLIFHDLNAKDMVVNKAFQVAEIIKKLPPSWNDFKNYLKYKRKEMKLENLVIRLRIEEDNKTAEKKFRKSSIIIGVNIVQEAPTKGKKRKKSNGQKSEQAKKKFKGNCYNCGKAGYKSSDYRAPRKDKDKDKGKANIVEEMEDADDLCAMISKCNLVGNPKE